MRRFRFVLTALLLGMACAAPAQMRPAAEALVAAVDPARRAKLVLPFDDPARLLRSALSEAGHRKVVNIIELELVLRELEFALSFLRDLLRDHHALHHKN